MKFFSFNKVEESVAQYSAPNYMDRGLVANNIKTMLEEWHKERFGKFAAVACYNLSRGFEIRTSSTCCSFDIHEQDTDTDYTLVTVIAHVWECVEK